MTVRFGEDSSAAEARVSQFEDWRASATAVRQLNEIRRHSEREATAVVDTVGGQPFSLFCRITDEGTIGVVSFHGLVGPPDVDAVVRSAAELSDADLRRVHAVFDASYDDADHDYIERTQLRLSDVVLALRGEEVLGFYFADVRRVDLPRLPEQLVWYAGMACVTPAERRTGVSKLLGGVLWQRVVAPAASSPDERILGVSLYANGASYSADLRSRGLTPSPDDPNPKGWRGDVDEAVAAAYGVAQFDRGTFVAAGPGRPIGRENVSMRSVDDRVLHLFQGVDRARGDRLLTLMWIPEEPPGW